MYECFGIFIHKFSSLEQYCAGFMQDFINIPLAMSIKVAPCVCVSFALIFLLFPLSPYVECFILIFLHFALYTRTNFVLMFLKTHIGTHTDKAINLNHNGASLFVANGI